MPVKRVITALILLAVLLPAVFAPDPRVWAGLTLVFLLVAAWEWGRLLGGRQAAAALAALTALIGGSLLARWPHPGWPQPLVDLACIGAIVLWLAFGGWRLYAAGVAGRADRRADRRERKRFGELALAAIWLLVCWLALAELRVLGAAVLLVAMAIVWVADISAYFCGRAWGRHKLAPAISPGKTREGAIGALIVTALAGWASASVPALSAALPARLIAGWGAVAGALALMLLVLLSILGDLHESVLKRRAGVKDSGILLPGHGGVLDRIDALIPVMPAAVLLHHLLG